MEPTHQPSATRLPEPPLPAKAHTEPTDTPPTVPTPPNEGVWRRSRQAEAKALLYEPGFKEYHGERGYHTDTVTRKIVSINEDGVTVVVERRLSLTTLYERTLTYSALTPVMVIMCFCCSCGDYGSDPACRNHGFAGLRPCEVHGMPGSVWDDSDEMPESVQAVRRKNA